MPDLTKLTLHGNKLTSKCLDPVLGLKKLKFLWLDGPRISRRDFGVLGELPALEELILSGMLLAGGEFNGLARLTKLKSLSIRNQGQLRPEDLSFLPDSLEALEISNCVGITDDVIVRLTKLPKLKSLTLRSLLGLTDQSMETLTSHTHLDSLTLADLPITAKASQSIGKMTKLKRLAMHYVKIDRTLLHQVANFPRLEELSLSSEGTAGRADALQLKKARQLKKISLYFSNGINLWRDKELFQELRQELPDLQITW
jgi:hypothetical protein